MTGISTYEGFYIVDISPNNITTKSDLFRKIYFRISGFYYFKFKDNEYFYILGYNDKGVKIIVIKLV